MKIAVSDLVQQLNATTTPTFHPDLEFSGLKVNTDSRALLTGDIFFPLKGEHFDGHVFLKQAFDKGACFAFCEHTYFQQHPELDALPLVLIEDTLKTYQKLGQIWRRKLNPQVIAITGSSGKTSTKEILYQLVSQQFNTLKTEGNFNNEIGVPKTLLRLEASHQVCLVEMGMRGLGQIQELADIAEPDIGIISNIGPVHISELGSIENVAKAKWELADYLAQNAGHLVIPDDDPHLRRLAKTRSALPNIIWTGSSEKSQLKWESDTAHTDSQLLTYQWLGKQHKATLNLPGLHQLKNLLNCIGAALQLQGFHLPQHIELKVPTIFGRSETFHTPTMTLVNDAYNANPDSMRASLDVLKTVQAQRKVAVLGFMGELGPQSHQFHVELGQHVDQLNLDLVCVIGDGARGIAEGITQTPSLFYDQKKEAISDLPGHLKAGDHILIKASRSAGLEDIFEALKSPPGP